MKTAFVESTLEAQKKLGEIPSLTKITEKPIPYRAYTKCLNEIFTKQKCVYLKNWTMSLIPLSILNDLVQWTGLISQLLKLIYKESILSKKKKKPVIFNTLFY